MLMLPLARLSNTEILELIESCPSNFNSTKNISISVLRKTHNSSLYLVTTPVFPHPLLIKQIKTNDTKLQYDSLVSVFEEMKESAYRVPKPIAYIPEKNVIIMEYIHSECLETLLLKKNISLSDKYRYIKRSAQWLSNFHTAFRDGFQIFDSEKKIEDLSKTISTVKSVLYKDSELVSILHWLKSTAPYIQAYQTSFGHTHGDFKPANIIDLKGDIYGIDILLDSEGVQLMDVVQFTNHLLFLTMNRTGKPYHQHVHKWTEYFLDIYTKDQAAIDVEVFYWLRLQHLMRYWSFAAARKIPFSFIQKNKLKNEISDLYRSMKSGHLKVQLPKHTLGQKQIDPVEACLPEVTEL